MFSPFKGWSRKSFELQQKCKPLLYTQGTFATFEVSPTKRSHHNLRFFTNNFARCKGMSLNCYQNVFCWTWEIDTSRILRHENSLLKFEIMEDRGNIKSDWTGPTVLYLAIELRLFFLIEPMEMQKLYQNRRNNFLRGVKV